MIVKLFFNLIKGDFNYLFICQTYFNSQTETILLKGNYFEIYFVLEIIAQLTFDEKISSDLKKSNDFKCILEKLDQQNINEIKSEDEKKLFKVLRNLLNEFIGIWRIKLLKLKTLKKLNI